MILIVRPACAVNCASSLGCIARFSVLKYLMVKPTLREQNKNEKLRRITDAARQLFSTQGFDATATRQIADEARVGLATLFLYAADKRDLLFLACNDDLEALTQRAFAKIDPAHPLIDQLIEAFSHFFAFYARNRRLSRDLLRELTFYTSGQQSERFQATRHDTIARVETLVRNARDRGQIAPSVDDATTAEVIFYVFAAAVRRWLGEGETSADVGVTRLGVLLSVVVDGLRASLAKEIRSGTLSHQAAE